MNTHSPHASAHLFAKSNFQRLIHNPYPGSGIVTGLDETGLYMVQVYWIMEQSEHEMQSVLKVDGETGRLYTEVADLSQVTDPSPIIYDAMCESPPFYVVSNGDQTDTVIDRLHQELFFLEPILCSKEYKPDPPNFTPRITAANVVTMFDQRICLSILRKSMFGDKCESLTYELDTPPGFGYCITTYIGDSNPLPPFRGEPLLMPLVGGMRVIAETYWKALNEANRVSLAIKWIEIHTGRSRIFIINKFNQV